MQQRQLRLGDILDDYCPRERRLTNHAVVAMVGDDVKRTRCTTCDAEHEYKQAKVPRQRRKSEPAALAAPVADVSPKKVVHEAEEPVVPVVVAVISDEAGAAEAPGPEAEEPPTMVGVPEQEAAEEGPVHRPLIRAQLPRIEGQPPTPRQAPDFTIRQPAGRANRFRPRQPRGGQGGQGFQGFQGNRSGGGFAGSGNTRGPRPPGGGANRSPLMSHQPRRHGQQGPQGRKRSK